MLRLNIIPNSLKKENKTKEFYKIFKNILYIIFICFAIHSGILLLAKYILQSYQSITTSQANIITSHTKNYSNRIKDINQQINFIEQIQSKTVEWSQFFKNIEEISNEEITFTKIKTNMENNNILLFGHAQNRTALLTLKEKLENSENFTDINLPIRSLFEKNNINFEISAQIKSYDFK